MENIQEVGHLQLKTEPHGGSNSEIQRTFWFILAKSPLRDPSIASAPSVQIPTSFSHFVPLLSKHMATTWNTSASVVVSSGLQNSISSSIKEDPTKRTKTSNWAGWSRSAVFVSLPWIAKKVMRVSFRERGSQYILWADRCIFQC